MDKDSDISPNALSPPHGIDYQASNANYQHSHHIGNGKNNPYLHGLEGFSNRQPNSDGLYENKVFSFPDEPHPISAVNPYSWTDNVLHLL